MVIRVLPDEVASQIAAGEVVERPASVVKELLENALDAGAKSVQIEILEAGKQLIQVADDGAGIPADELVLAVTRHATSKLTSANDLLRISTLGFRGEALASIASVSQTTITSCTEGASAGARLRIEGGIVGDVQPVGAPKGTVVRVENLFYNVPARLKFLKKDYTESSQITRLVTRYAIAYPEVRIGLFQDGKVTLQTAGNGNRKEVLVALHGPDIARQMLEVDGDYEDFSISGFISPTSLTRSNRSDITFFVNGRWVQDVSLVTALTRAYHTLLMVGRFPMAVLFVRIPADEVDVNVHPAKSEVRFRESERVFADVQRATRRALLAYTSVPEVNLQPRFPSEPVRVGWAQPGNSTTEPVSWPESAWQRPDKSGGPSTVLPGISLPDKSELAAQPALPSGHGALLRLVGQIATAYLVAEGPDGLYLIDQHAAHERILFEKMMAQRSSTIPAQALLEPVPVELPPSQAKLLESQLETLAVLGFQVELFGRNTFLVRTVPQLLSRLSPVDALRVLVEDFEEDETPLETEIQSRIIARVCKRAAVKAGQVLSASEQQALLQDLEKCHSPRTCPHGRPTMIHLSVDVLERQFGRRGAR